MVLAFEGRAVTAAHMAKTFADVRRSTNNEGNRGLTPGLGYLQQLAAVVGCKVHCRTAGALHQSLVLTIPASLPKHDAR